MGYNIYVKKVTDDDSAKLDLEKEFPGFNFMRFNNFEEIGESKSLIVEEYADSIESRVYAPTTQVNSNGNFTMSALLFKGFRVEETNKDTSAYDTPMKLMYHLRNKFTEMGKLTIWDSVRDVRQDAVFTGKVTVDDSFNSGDKDDRCLVVKFEFKKIKNVQIQ